MKKLAKSGCNSYGLSLAGCTTNIPVSAKLAETAGVYGIGAVTGAVIRAATSNKKTVLGA
jgi:hypothetical protein